MENNSTFNPNEPLIIPEPEPALDAPKPQKTPLAKPWFIGIIGVLIGAVVATSIFFLFFNKPAMDNQPSSEQPTETANTPENKTDEEIIQTYEEEIIKADEDDQFILKLDKASRLVSMSKYNEALAVLSAISTEGLDDYKLYQLYSNYVFLYDNLGDEAETARYMDLFNEVYARLDAEGRFNEAKKAEVTE